MHLAPCTMPLSPHASSFTARKKVGAPVSFRRSALNPKCTGAARYVTFACRSHSVSARLSPPAGERRRARCGAFPSLPHNACRTTRIARGVMPRELLPTMPYCSNATPQRHSPTPCPHRHSAARTSGCCRMRVATLLLSLHWMPAVADDVICSYSRPWSRIDQGERMTLRSFEQCNRWGNVRLHRAQRKPCLLRR